MNILKKSAVKTIKTSAKTIVIIIVKNIRMQNALNCQITSKNKMNMKIFKTIPIWSIASAVLLSLKTN